MTSILVILISLSLFFSTIAMGQVSLEFSGEVKGSGNMSLVHEFQNVSVNVSNVSIAQWNNTSIWVWENENNTQNGRI